VFAIDRPGSVICNWSQGGSTMVRWTKTAIFNDAVFTELAPQKGPNPILLLEAAESYAQFPTQAAQQAQMQAIVSRFRTGVGTYAPVVVQTGYPSSTSGIDRRWYDWLPQSIASMRGVSLINTHDALPAYADGVAAGYYDARAVPEEPYQTDGVHYGPTIGVPAFAAAIGDLLAAAAV
jgi:hypothetical protein